MIQQQFSQPNIHFIHTTTGDVHQTIWEELKKGGYKNIAPENLLENAFIDGVDRTLFKPVLKDYFLVQKGMLWDKEKKMPYDPIFIPNRINANLDMFLATAHQFFEQFKGKKIGVQLSGGLDSSIIIGLLKYFKIPFKLVGLANKRFDFRTESHIQNILSEWADETILIDYEACLPYSHIDKVPPHQYPEEYIRTFGPDCVMAKTAKQLGIEVNSDSY